jgi:hypothetical protein
MSYQECNTRTNTHGTKNKNVANYRLELRADGFERRRKSVSGFGAGPLIVVEIDHIFHHFCRQSRGQNAPCDLPLRRLVSTQACVQPHIHSAHSGKQEKKGREAEGNAPVGSRHMRCGVLREVCVRRVLPRAEAAVDFAVNVVIAKVQVHTCAARARRHPTTSRRRGRERRVRAQ